MMHQRAHHDERRPRVPLREAVLLGVVGHPAGKMGQPRRADQ
jgi:hypothetical protein